MESEFERVWRETEDVFEQAGPKIKELKETYFVRNINKRRLALGIAAGLAIIVIQTQKQNLKKKESVISLLNLENQFLHFVISGISSEDTDPNEFNKQISDRAEFINIVSKL